MPWPVHVDLVSQWTIPAPLERVWGAIVDAERWPQWWPGVAAVRTVRAGGAGGEGAIRRIEWSSRFGRAVVADVEAIELKPNELLRSRCRGPCDGEGLWLLRSEGGRTLVTCVWRVKLGRGWMRFLVPLIAPLLRWNHRAVMCAGERGLVRHLAGSARPQPRPAQRVDFDA